MLGNNISKIRKSKGMSLNSFAKEIGISPGYLSDIENNIKKNPSMEILGKISNVFEIPVSHLLSTEERLDLAVSSLNEINETVNQYYSTKNNSNFIKELQIDSDTNLLINKIKKLSEKDKKIVEVLVNQLLKEE